MKGIGLGLWILLSVALSLPARAQVVEYIHTDALGTPVAVTGANGNLVELDEYEPYGQLLNHPPNDEPGFTGHVQDAVTGLTYMQQRYYDPGIGMMLSVDPVTAYDQPITNFCRYCYARNNPYKFNDPDGRAAQAVWGAVIGAGVEIFIQTQIQGKSFRDVDVSDVAIAAGAGALTGGIASAAALSAAKGTVTVGRAVAQTSAGAGAVGVTASLAKDVANGETPKVGDALVNGAASAALGAGGQRLALNPVAKLESQWSKGGLNATVAETTRAANQAGPDAAKVAAATSAAGSNVSDAAGVAADVARAKYEERPR